MKKIEVPHSKADIAQKILTLNGEPYSLKEYPMFNSILNSQFHRLLLRSGRQVSKTTVEAAGMVLEAALTPYNKLIYCNSSGSQTNSFSTTKLDPFLKQSPMVYRNFMVGKNIVDNVLTKRLSNYSYIQLSYFSETADRVRGMSGNAMYLDEVQDMLFDAMIDAEECLSAAKEPRVTYAGTSKTTITPLEFLWTQSSQREWIIPCSGCGKWNRPYHACIGKHGLICKHCGKPLNTYEGRWHSFNVPEDGSLPYADGFWIPQIVMPLHCCNEDKWKRLLEKRETYPENKFDNEVMGLPSGEGDSPITEEMLQAMCRENIRMLDRSCAENASGARFIAAGIDWGGGGKQGTSRTVLSIYAVYPERPLYRKIFGKIYQEGEPTKHVEDIAMWLIRFGCHMVCGDHGGGNFAMSQLAGKIPSSMRLIPVMYSDSSAPVRWDEHGRRYTVNRTTLIDDFFSDIQRGYIEAFRWSEFKPFAKDILNVRQMVIGEERGISRRVWRHGAKDPDDALHSMVFGWFAARVLSARMDFTVAC